jgi:hypothetical protein
MKECFSPSSVAVTDYLRLVGLKRKEAIWLTVLEVQDHSAVICSASSESLMLLHAWQKGRRVCRREKGAEFL